jgi:2-phospho-L-lactate guanylyltransferase
VTTGARPQWGVVVPVKRLDVAKSRLAAYGEHGRRRLALAFAEDVVRAAVACPAVRRVLVVTDDEQARWALAALGADVRADVPDAGLNPALEHGAALLRQDAAVHGVAALSADLPALRPEDLHEALAAAEGRAFVADSSGAGTTLLAADGDAVLLAAFGAGSAAVHRASGARELAGAPGLCRDVDTPHDLAQAALLGVGASTSALLDVLAPGRATPGGARSPGQGTMRG